MAGSMRPRATTPSMAQMLLLGLPTFALAFVNMPLNIVLPAFYAAHTQVTLVQIGLVTTFSRLFDVLTDPMIGVLSDRTKSRLGRRKPWVLAGGFLCAGSILFLFNPTHRSDVIYFGLSSYFLYLGFSLFDIPRNAWTTEISRDQEKRTTINLILAVMAISGALIFWLSPIVLSGLTGTTQITGASLTAMSVLFAIIMPAASVLAAIYVPTGIPVASAPLTLKSLVWSATRNRPLRIFTVAAILWNAGQSAYLSVFLIFVTDRLKLGAAFAPLMIGFFIVQIATAPVWAWLSNRFGRNRAWAFGLATDALLRPLVLLLPPGHALVGMAALVGVSAFLSVPTNFAPPAMLSDAVDYDFMRSGVNKAGNIFSLYTLVGKAASALGAGGVLILLGWMHYKVGAVNSQGAEMALTLAYAVVPGILAICAAVFIAMFPLSARRHAIVRRRLEGRAQRPAQAV